MSQDRSSTRARVVVIVLAVATLASGVYFAGRSGSTPDAYSNDFNVYYHAAREIIAGRDPYQHSLGDWTPYIYPPLLAELIVPLAILPLPVAAYLWFLISAASVFFAAWFSARLADDKRLELTNQNNLGSNAHRAAIAACAVLLVLRFVLDTFDLGQVNAVVAALAVAHVFLYARDRKALSAIALMLAVSIKLTPALLLFYHVAKLRLRFAVACAALIVAVTALSFLPFGVRAADVFQEFWGRTVRNEQGYDFAYSGNQSLRGAVARLSAREPGDESAGNENGSRKPAESITLLISIGFLAAAVFAAVQARRELAAAAPFFCGMVLLSPLSWKAHYVVLILPAAYLLFLAGRWRTARPMVLSVLAVVFVLFNLTSPRVIGLEAAEWADFHSLVVWGALLMFVGCVAWSRLKGTAEL